jgi:hypothetical protein
MGLMRLMRLMLAGEVASEHLCAFALEDHHIGACLWLHAVLINREEVARQHIQGQRGHRLRAASRCHFRINKDP